MRARYSSRRSSGARDATTNVTSRWAMWMPTPLKLSAQNEQLGQPSSPVGAEHEVVHEELAPSVEEIGQRPRPVLGRELVLIADRDPGQRPPLAAELVAPPGQLLLGIQQGEPGRHSSRVPIVGGVTASAP